MKRLLCLLLVLYLALGASAMAEDASAVRLIDRIADPAAEPDFAFAPGAELLEIIFPQVLNADAMLLRCGGQAILVDCASAKQASRVTDMLSQLGVTHLDAIINTHPHYDHLQGLEIVATAVQTDALWVSFPADYNQHMRTALEAAQRLELPVVTYGDEDSYALGGATLTAWCKGDDAWNCNERSAVWKVTFGDASALLTADMLLKTEKRLLETIPPEELDVDILKYPHHGLNKLNDEFCAAVSPLYAVITNNGTKSSVAKQYLRTKHIPFALTVPGFVSLTTDGSTWLIERLTPGQIVDSSTYSDAPQEE